MEERNRLDDPAYARFAWGRFRRILAAVTIVGVGAAVIALVLMERQYGALGPVAILATMGGVIATVAMAGALMGLAFLSSGTGHDEDVERFGD